MIPEKDTFILSTIWDFKRKQSCQFKECPKYGWLNFVMGYESEQAPQINYRLCPTHYSEVMQSWIKDYLPDILNTFEKVDRKEYGLDERDN